MRNASLSFILLAFITAPAASTTRSDAPAYAYPADAKVVHVDLSDFGFAPSKIQMKAGKPIMLHLVGHGSGSHDFTAPEFFAAAKVRPEDRQLIKKGKIDVRGGGEAAVILIPAAGHYTLKCSHPLHAKQGMTGSIDVTW